MSSGRIGIDPLRARTVSIFNTLSLRIVLYVASNTIFLMLHSPNLVTFTLSEIVI